MKTKGKAWQLVVTVLLIAAFVYTAFFGVAVKYGDVTKTYIKGAQDIRFGVDIKGGVNVTFAPSDNYDATDDQLDAAQLVIENRLVGLNVTDVRGDQLRVLGKGNKERVLFLNEACQQALQDWLTERNMLALIDKEALFITHQNRRRISRAAVHKLVKKHLAASGLDSTQYSAHKLRHTAATLMLQNGVDVRTLQEVLGHDHLNTTQIYTHVDNDDLRTAARANPLGMVKKKKKGSEDET